MTRPWIRLYVRAGTEPARVVPGLAERGWVTPWMYHCLPLVTAGQLGWTVLNPAAFVASWDGTSGDGGVRVSSQGHHVSSHFGQGIVTIDPGFYVRTSTEVDLLVRAVPNQPEGGATMAARPRPPTRRGCASRRSRRPAPGRASDLSGAGTRATTCVPSPDVQSGTPRGCLAGCAEGSEHASAGRRLRDPSSRCPVLDMTGRPDRP